MFSVCLSVHSSVTGFVSRYFELKMSEPILIQTGTSGSQARAWSDQLWVVTWKVWVTQCWDRSQKYISILNWKRMSQFWYKLAQVVCGQEHEAIKRYGSHNPEIGHKNTFRRDFSMNCNRTWQVHSVVNALWVTATRMQKVKGQGQMRPKLDLEALWRHCSRRPWV